MSTSDSFVQRARLNQALNDGPVCGVSKLLSILPEDLKVGFLEAMDDGAIYGSTIAELMTEEGYPIQPDAIRRHRNNRCKCKMRNEQKKKLDGG